MISASPASRPVGHHRLDLLRSGLFGGLCLVVLLMFGCGRDLSHLEPVPHPDLSSVEKSARSQLEEGKKRLEKAMNDRDDSVVAAAFGSMGELYHAYDLPAAAAVCYRNAAVMAPTDFAWPYYSGLLAQEQGDLAAAEASFRKALELRSQSHTVRARLAETLLLSGQAEEASPLYEAMASDDEFAAAAAYGKARVAAASGVHDEAVPLFQQAIELQPSAGGVRNGLAQSLRSLGRAEEAQAQLALKGSGAVSFPDPLKDRLIKLPRSAGSFLRRGNQALLAGRLKEAEDLFSRGKEANLDNIELRLNLALTHVRQGRLDVALQELQDALKRDPNNAQVHHDLGTTYRAQGLQDKAVEAFNKAVELEPEYVAAHFNLANTFGTSNRWPQAEASARRVLELEPDHTRARYLVAMAQHQQGQSAVAEAELRRLLDLEPTERLYREGLAGILSSTQRVDEAIQLILDGADLEQPAEEAVQLLNSGAKMVWAQRRQQAAIRMWRKAVELAPESSEALTSLANGLQLFRRRGEALELFTKATELNPQNTTAWLSAENLRILEGDHVTARKRLEQAVELHPGHMGLVNTLARLLATSWDSSVRDGEKAVVYARQAYGQQASLDHAETMAMALAEMGRFERAIQFQRGLVQQAQATGDQVVLRRLVTHLRLFESRRPVRSKAPG